MLTAFVIESYQGLSEDNTETTADLLRTISGQIANHSLPAAPPPAPFQPVPTTVWINSLWFLSLILSLASALFGMITKQWLREFMEWTTSSWTPRQAIILRQKRYEAFMAWKVRAIIAAIPALLEVALIMFFAGLVIFLRTINNVVAWVSTAAIALFIVLVILATLLPTFAPTCAYKSPSGWAFVRLASLLKRSSELASN